MQLPVVDLDDGLNLGDLLSTLVHELAEVVGLDTDGGADAPLDLFHPVLQRARRNPPGKSQNIPYCRLCRVVGRRGIASLRLCVFNDAHRVQRPPRHWLLKNRARQSASICVICGQTWPGGRAGESL